MDRIAAARGANVCFRFDLVELRRCCTLRRRLATAIINIIKCELAWKHNLHDEVQDSHKAQKVRNRCGKER